MNKLKAFIIRKLGGYVDNPNIGRVRVTISTPLKKIKVSPEFVSESRAKAISTLFNEGVLVETTETLYNPQGRYTDWFYYLNISLVTKKENKQ